MPISYDFSGIATAYGVLCQDGRVIKQGAFDHQAGQIVPMVWRHGHDDIRNVVGHAILGRNEDPPGMRVNAFFNNTDEGQRAKLLVHNKDIEHLSIWANQLTEGEGMFEGEAVIETKKGTIREVSLVLAGKNPGAFIDRVVRHSDDPLDPDSFIEDGIIIHTDFSIELEEVEEVEEEEDAEEEAVEHQEEPTVEDILKTLNEDQQNLFDIILHAAALGEKTPPKTSSKSNGEGPTVQAVFDTLNEEQKNILYYMAGELSPEEISQGDLDPMPKTHNIFEDDEVIKEQENVISHEQAMNILSKAVSQRASSLRHAFMEADVVLSHSITDIDFMFPETRNVKGGGPQWYARPMEWVESVLGATNPRPFARIKSMYADLTGADARAKGYVTGAQKVEEVIAVLKRSTLPQTVYKLQKLDRDDIIDITDFDVVVWLKSEMRMMLREEIARAILISDGRNDTGADAIMSTNIRPIYNDDPVYTIDAIYNDVGNEKAFSAFTDAECIALVDFIASQRQYYRGAGSPVFYTQPEVLSRLLLIRDADTRRLYRSEAELASELRVSRIVEIPPMSGMARTGEVDPPSLPVGTYNIETLGVIVNLSDYVIGQDRGGKTAFFDDFDIDFNKYTYLYETRMSGALVNPKSAISVENVTAKTA